MNDPKTNPDRDDLELEAETIADLELKEEDADVVQGGKCTVLAYIQSMTNP